MAKTEKVIVPVGYEVDKSGLKDLKSAFDEIQKLSKEAANAHLSKGANTINTQRLDEIKHKAKLVEEALNNAYNPKVNTVNINKFNAELKKSNYSVNEFKADMAALGPVGSKALLQLSNRMSSFHIEVKKANNVLTSLWDTLKNTIKWNISSSIIQGFTGALSDAWNYTKALDKSLNNIQIVTGKSASTMREFAREANRAAKELGAYTTDYTNASLIYYQQGLTESEVKARTETTIKVANVTKQSAEEVSEQLTAVWNGYKVNAEEAELYIDKLSAVAATTASDLEELSDAMSKVASTANAMGVNMDQLTAQASTIISVTRQDASQVGTALKTIYARLGDLAVDGTDEFGVKLGEVSSKLQVMGVEVLDRYGEMRDLGVIMEEVADKWGTWTKAQQQAAAVAMAGKRQYNNLIALFENWDMYESAKLTSENAEGTLDEQNARYKESLESAQKELAAAGDAVKDALIDEEQAKGFIKALTAIVDGIANLTKALGGLPGIINTLGAILMQVFNKQITGSITKAITGFQNFIGLLKSKELTNVGVITQMANRAQDFADNGIINYETGGRDRVSDAERQALVNKASTMGQNAGLFRTANKDQMNEFSTLVDERVGLDVDYINAQEEVNAIKNRKLHTEDEIQKHVAAAREAAGAEIKGKSPAAKRKRKEEMDKAGAAAENEYRKHNTEIYDERERERGYRERYITKAQDFISSPINAPSLESSSEEEKKAYVEQIKSKYGKSSDELEGLHVKKNLVNDMQTAIQDYDTSTNETDQIEALKRIEELQRLINDDINARKEKCEAVIQSTNKEEAAVKKLNKAQAKVNKNQEKQNKLFKDLKKQNIAATITNVANAAMGLASAAQAVKGIWEVWTDDALSTGEKISATLSAIIPIMMGIVPVIQLIGTVAKMQGTAAQMAWGWIGVALMALTAIASVILSFIDFRSEEEKQAEAINKINDSLKELRTTISETKKEFEKIGTIADDLYNVDLTFSNLVRGSKAWKDAIEANKKAFAELQEMLNKQGIELEYGEDYYIDSDGAHVVTDKGKNKIKGSEDKKIERLENREAYLNDEKQAIAYYGEDHEKWDDYISRMGGMKAIMNFSDEELNAAIEDATSDSLTRQELRQEVDNRKKVFGGGGITSLDRSMISHAAKHNTDLSYGTASLLYEDELNQNNEITEDGMDYIKDVIATVTGLDKEQIIYADDNWRGAVNFTWVDEENKKHEEAWSEEQFKKYAQKVKAQKTIESKTYNSGLKTFIDSNKTVLGGVGVDNHTLSGTIGDINSFLAVHNGYSDNEHIDAAIKNAKRDIEEIKEDSAIKSLADEDGNIDFINSLTLEGAKNLKTGLHIMTESTREAYKGVFTSLKTPEQQNALANLSAEWFKEGADTVAIVEALESQGVAVDITNDNWLKFLGNVDKTGAALFSQSAKLQENNEMLNTELEVLGTIGEETGDRVRKIMSESIKNNQASIDATRQGIKNLEHTLATDLTLSEEQIKNYEEQIKEGYSNLASYITNQKELLLKEAEIKLTELFQLDTSAEEDYRIRTQWEQRKEYNETFLDNTTKNYNINKFTRQVQTSIGIATTAKAQAELNSLLDEQLKILKEKDKLTQRDVERANQLYELKLAEIALEEAQANKSKVQLVRDASGGYSYSFVEDADARRKAEQALEDKQQQLYESDKASLQDSTDKVLDLSERIQSAVLEGMGAGLTGDQAINAVMKGPLGDMFNSEVGNLSEEWARQKELYGDELEMPEILKSILGEDGTSADSYIKKITDDLTSVGTEYNDEYDSLKTSANTFATAVKSFDGAVGQMEKMYGTDAESFGSAIIGQMDKMYVKQQLNTMLSNASSTDDLSVAYNYSKKYGITNLDNDFMNLAADLGKHGVFYANEKHHIYKVVEYTKTLEAAQEAATKLGRNKKDGESYTAFDTGGYTGSWGSEGRVAMLHQKELVLNAADTSNILSAVSIVRDAMAMMSSSVGIMGSSNIGFSESQQPSPIVQNISVNADFSGVSCKDEIQEAFDTLANYLAQKSMETQ